MGAEPRRAPGPQHAEVAACSAPAWPGDELLTCGEAERAVRAVLAGTPGSLDPRLVTRLGASVTELERAAFDGSGDDDVTAAVRAATALRWRLAAVLADAPPACAVDEGAVSGLLADADAVLASLATAAEGAPPAFAEAAAEIRRALVSDAVAVQQTAQRLGVPAPAQTTGAARPAPAAARVLSVVAGETTPEPRPAFGWKLPALLVVALLAGGGFHAWRFLNRPELTAPVAGAPTTAVTGAGARGQTVLFTRDGRPLPPPELERLRAAQAQAGMRVRELGPGAYAIEPDTKEEAKR